MKIAQVIREAGSWGDINPSIINQGVGGREGALIRLATEWAKSGHEVTNFVPTAKATRITEPFETENMRWVKDHPGAFGGPFGAEGDGTPPLFRETSKDGFHEYIPMNMAKPTLRSFPFDAVVAWECPSVYADDDICEKQPVRLVHMQVAHLEEALFAEQFSTGVVALSEWAKDFLVHSGLSMSGDKLYVRPNGVNLSSYPYPAKKDKHISVVYSSSPDRGLLHLLRMWPSIRKIDRKANLFVAYGVKRYTEVMRWSHSRIGEMCVEIERLMEQPGVIDVGKIGQDQLAKLQLKANLWLYPADTIQATETGCITAIENMAAGNPCIMSDADCLGSEFGGVAQVIPLPLNTDEYVESVSLAWSVPEDRNRMAAKARSFAESRNWSRIAPTWIDLFEENRSA